MNSNVFEIISQLVRKLLYDGEMVKNEKELIISLREEGYNLRDISQAFEFIFSSSQIINLLNKDSSDEEINLKSFKNRKLNYREKFKFSLEVQGIIIELNFLNLVREEELEMIIAKAMSKFKDCIEIEDLWIAINEVVNNEIKIIEIWNNIDGFQ